MSDEQWLEGLRAASRREEAKALPDELARPLGDDFQARVLAKVQAERARPVRLSRGIAPMVAIVALAAAVLLFVRARGGPSADVPEYVSTLSGAEQDLRGAPDGARRFRKEGTFTLTLQPSRSAGPIDVRFARITAGRAVPIEVAHRVSPAGALSVEAPVREVLGADPGPVTIAIVVAPAGRMPADWIDAARADGVSRPGVRIVREPVVLAAD